MAERFGDYELVRKVAAGGMAEIYLARTESVPGVGRDVIVKRMLPELAFRADFVQMFLDEARLAASFTHPNLVQVFHLGQEGESYYIAMELVDGPHLGTLFAHSLRLERPLDLELCVHIVARAADGLHYAHEQRDPATGIPLHIVHRDISPQNVLVSRHGDVKVSDFGVAKAETQSTKTRTGIVKGKVSYLSPEQCLGDPVDRRTDIFALGIVLYELLVRRRLFRDRSDLVTMQRITMENLDAPSAKNPDVDASLDEIALRALAKRPEERFQTAAALSEALDGWLVSRGIADGPQRLARWMTMHGAALGPGSSSKSPDSSASASGLDDDDAEDDPTVSTLAQLTSLPSPSPGPHDAVGEPLVVSSALVTEALVSPEGGSFAEQRSSLQTHRPAGTALMLGLVLTAVLLGAWLLSRASTSGEGPDPEAPSALLGGQNEVLGDEAGVLQVTTSPPGVPVLVDGQPAGTSPVKIRRTRGMGDDVQIQALFPDQAPVVQTARFVPGRESPVSLIARVLLEVVSEPSGAQISVDEVLVGVTPLAPLALLPVPAGTAQLRLRLPGYDDYTETLSLEPGKTLHIEAALQRSSPRLPGTARAAATAGSGYGVLVVNSKPWGTVYIDGKKVGPTPLRLPRVKAGSHSVRIVNEEPGFGFSKTLRVDVKRAQDNAVGFVFTKAGDRYEFERVVR